MKHRKTSIALGALLLIGTRSVAAQTTPTIGGALGTVSPVTVEAESMTLSSYVVEHGNRIKLSGSKGSASKAFAGATGSYSMRVYVYPETDGRSILEVYKGSSTTPLRRYTYPLSSTATSFTVTGVKLNKGETIRLVGYAVDGAVARVDKVVLTPEAAAPAPSTSSPLPSAPAGSTACANPAGGYQGFGRNTTGGADKPVYRVTNRNDSGAGSLRDAVSQGNRCVVFDVAGTIPLSGNLVVRGANITIDGSTAPSPGVTLTGAVFLVAGTSGASNVVVRGLRVRNTPGDAVSIYNASDVVVDRVSVSGFGDGGIDVTQKSRNVTIQWSIFGPGVASHNMISLIKYDTTRVSVHHNLFIGGDDRNPYCGRSDTATSTMTEMVCDVRNNVVWDYLWYGTAIRHYATANVVNNYYYTTRTTTSSKTVYQGNGGVAYVAGNQSQNGWYINGSASATAFTADARDVPATTDALTAAKQVIAQAGARGPRFGLDTTDRNLVARVSLP